MARKRGKSVLVRMTEEEFEKIEKKSYKSKLSKQDYILKSSLDKEILVIEGIQDLVIQLSKVGTNINQIARKVNTGEIDDCSFQLDGIGKELSEVWQLLKHTMSKANRI